MARIENTLPLRITLQRLFWREFKWDAEFRLQSTLQRVFDWSRSTFGKWLHQGSREKAGWEAAEYRRREWWCGRTPRGRNQGRLPLQTLPVHYHPLSPKDLLSCKVFNIPLLQHQRTKLWPSWSPAFSSPQGPHFVFLKRGWVLQLWPRFEKKINTKLVTFLLKQYSDQPFCIYSFGNLGGESHTSNSCKFHHLSLIHLFMINLYR